MGTSSVAATATVVAAGKLTLLPTAWTADTSQAATITVSTAVGIGRVSPPLATPPAHLTIPGIPFSTDPIAPMTVDSDGRVHSDGT